MEVGSRVKYVEQFPPDMILGMSLEGYRILELPVLEKIYTIKSIWYCSACKEAHILVEELVVGYTNKNNEISTYGHQWREMLPTDPIQKEWVDELIESLPNIKEKEKEPEYELL